LQGWQPFVIAAPLRCRHDKWTDCSRREGHRHRSTNGRHTSFDTERHGVSARRLVKSLVVRAVGLGAKATNNHAFHPVGVKDSDNPLGVEAGEVGTLLRSSPRTLTS
jgi:hypothetical protein